jgi:hypothetical protein
MGAERDDLLEKSVNRALDLSAAFSNLRAGKEFQPTDEVLEIILPYCFFNPPAFRSLPAPIQKRQDISYRFNLMRGLFDSQIKFCTDSFDACREPGHRLAHLKNDLDLIKDGGDPLVLVLNQYERFMIDSLAVLYARYRTTYSLSVFISAASTVSENAMISLCFTFPHFIPPMFKEALCLKLSPRVICPLCLLSLSHRPFLLPKLSTFDPVCYALLATRCFPDQSPSLITAASNDGLPAIRSELQRICQKSNLSSRFFLCQARCCAMDATMTDHDAELLDACRDETLLICVLFTVDNPGGKILRDFFERFQRTDSSMRLIFEIICDENGVGSRIIHQTLGEGCNWELRLSFRNHVLKSLDVSELKPSWFGSDASSLAFLSFFKDELSYMSIKAILRGCLNDMTSVSLASIDVLEHFVFLVNQKAQDMQAIVREVLSNCSAVFERDFVHKNPCPALFYTVLILTAEMRIAPRGDSGEILFPQINTFPLRWVLCCASQNAACAPVIPYFCKLLHSAASHVFCQPYGMTQKPSYFLKFGETFDFDSLTEESVESWMAHRFMSSFDFVFGTISRLGGPSEFAQLHQAWNVPISVLRDRVKLKILSICLLDLAALFEKIRENTDYNNSVAVIFFKAIDLLKDPLIDAGILCELLDGLLNIVQNPFWLLGMMVNGTIDESLIEIIAKSVPYLRVLLQDARFGELCHKEPGLLLLLPLVSCIAEEYKDVTSYKCCNEVLYALSGGKAIVVNEQNLDIVLSCLMRIGRVFPDLCQIIDDILRQTRTEMIARVDLRARIDVGMDEIMRCVMEGNMRMLDDADVNL